MGKVVDMNSDMGESFGAYTLGNDQELMAIFHLQTLRVAFMQAIRRQCVRL